MSHKQVQQIRGTGASLATYIPLQGELVIDLDTGNMHVGNGRGGRWIFEPLPGRDYVGRAIIGTTPPANPFPGVFWWDSFGGQLYLYYDDGSSAAWIAATNQVAQPPPLAAGDPGSGTISGVVGGEGLIGGAFRGTVTLGLDIPVAVTNGGTGATTPAAALISLGALPIAGGMMTGALGINLGGPYQPIGYPLLFLGSNDGPEGAGAMMDAAIDSTTGNPFYLCRFARGTSAAPLPVQGGDVLGSYGITGRLATHYSNRAANIEMIAIEDWSDTAAGAAIRFRTNAPGAIESTLRAQLGQGLTLTTAAGAAPAGGDMGAGTVNVASGIYIDGEPAATKQEVDALSAALQEVQALAAELRDRLARIEQSHAP
jgi:hypothetical protein